MCVCSFRYPACNAHAPYYTVILSCPTLHYFSTSHTRHNFRGGKKSYWTSNVQLLSEKNSHSRKTSARYDHKPALVFMYSARYSCHILIKLEFSRQIFVKHRNTKFHENLSSGSRVVARGRTDGRTDRHDGANGRFSQFC